MTPIDQPALAPIVAMMRHRGVRQIYAKVLSANDNSKNQPYFGGDFEVLNILPSADPVPDYSGTHRKPIFKAALDFAWLTANGNIHPAPDAKLILYPQYPEVRFSGYLRGCREGPSELMGTTRQPGRILMLGVTGEGQILGYAAGPDSPVAREINSLKEPERVGVFVRVPVAADQSDARSALLAQLCRIAGAGWIGSKRLDAAGRVVRYNAPNGGGYTLEAELGIRPNGHSDPDYRGWEVKQYQVADFSDFRGGPITLMTPEPTGGWYTEHGVESFLRRYGYPDTKGRSGRINFGGTHRFGERCARTGLRLVLPGFDTPSGKIIDPTGGLALVDESGAVAAEWSYAGLMAHWRRKHALAAYVPSLKRAEPLREYQYSNWIRLGEGTDFLRFLAAVAARRVYYDPGIKLEAAGAGTRTKRRSQFRIRAADVRDLYHRMGSVDACAS